MRNIGYMIAGWDFGLATESLGIQHGMTPHGAAHMMVLGFIVWTTLVFSKYSPNV